MSAAVKHREAVARYKAKNREKIQAKDAVKSALRSGRLFRGFCIECGSPDTEAHHEDYSKPLDIIWYCPKHHGARHRLISWERAG